MKKFFLAIAAVLACTVLGAQSYNYTEASDLTLTGRLFTNTPNPYHRIDTVAYKGFNRTENTLVRMSSGIAVAFRTDSPSISVLTEYGDYSFSVYNGCRLAYMGYDLYIREDGEWKWAAAAVARNEDDRDKPVTLISDLPAGSHDCLMYLPICSEEYSVKVGVEDGYHLEALPNPFRHRVGVFGSSFTHGISTSRAGMTWPAILARETGIQMLSLGCNGNSKLQDAFANALADAQVDAFIFDAFSNPSIEQIQERLFPFIEKLQAAHPGIPLIFLQTIYRENRNFNTRQDKLEGDRIAFVAPLMKEACRKYKDVYFLTVTDAADEHFSTTVDGIHPGAYGYWVWAQSIKKPVLRILKKYGVK